MDGIPAWRENRREARGEGGGVEWGSQWRRGVGAARPRAARHRCWGECFDLVFVSAFCLTGLHRFSCLRAYVNSLPPDTKAARCRAQVGYFSLAAAARGFHAIAVCKVIPQLSASVLIPQLSASMLIPLAAISRIASPEQLPLLRASPRQAPNRNR